MANKILITTYNERIISALYLNGRIEEVEFDNLSDSEALLGAVYIGKVTKINSNINAAFLNIGLKEEVYYPVSDNPNPIFTQKIGRKPLCVGDELLVQVEKQAQKNKLAAVTSNLSFTGENLILTTGKTSIGISKKVDPLKRDELYRIIEEIEQSVKSSAEINIADKEFYDFGVIVRTNAADLISADQLQKEYISLYQSAIESLNYWIHRTCFSRVKDPESTYISFIRNTYHELYDEVVTDLPQVYNKLNKEFGNSLEKPIVLKEDPDFPLSRKYPLEKELIEAVKERVWLKSGGFLVIQPTEALTVIDVNTGKNINGKDKKETISKINREAAEEIVHQIRLRNISGIILIDFINLQSKAEQRMMDKDLLALMKELVKPDPTPTAVVDMTGLGLMELTRKKIRKPLSEQVNMRSKSVQN